MNTLIREGIYSTDHEINNLITKLYRKIYTSKRILKKFKNDNFGSSWQNFEFSNIFVFLLKLLAKIQRFDASRLALKNIFGQKILFPVEIKVENLDCF